MKPNPPRTRGETVMLWVVSVLGAILALYVLATIALWFSMSQLVI